MSKKRKVINGLFYLSSPASPTGDSFPLEEAARKLRQQGYTILSPNEVNAVSTVLPEAELRFGLRMLTQCHAIVLLPGWQNDKRCLLDLYIARNAGHEIYELIWDPNEEAVLIPSNSFDESIYSNSVISLKKTHTGRLIAH